MSCVRGCVRLPGLCASHQSPNSLLSAFSILFQAVSGYVQMVVSGLALPVWLVVSGFLCCLLSPIHLSSLVAIDLSPSLAGGVRLSGCLQVICFPLWQLICFPVWLVVSGLSAVSNSFVSPYTDSFVSQSGWWCPALAVSNSFVLPCGNSFVSQSGWWCPALRLSQSRWWCPALWLSLIRLSPSLAGGVQLFGWLQFICPPSWHFTCLPVWLVVSGSLAVSNSFVSGLWQFICLPVWLVVSGFLCCLLSPIHLSSLVAMHLSPSLAGGVRLSGCLQVICFPLWQLICFPVWLVVSGLSAVSNSCVSPYTDSFVSQSGWWCPALAVSNSCVSPCGNPFVSQSGWWCSALCASRSPCGWWCPALAMSKLFASRLWQFICLPVWLVASGFLPVSIQLGWWCPGLRLSPIHLFPLVAMHLSPSLASGVRLLGCLRFICLPLWQFICFPVWLVVSGLSAVSNSFVSPYTDSFVSQSGWWCPALAVSNSCVSPCGNPFVSQSGWWCSALCASRSPCGWWCPALAMSKLFASRLWQFICLPVWLVASGFLPVSIQLGWWCPGLRLSPIYLFPLVAMHLSPSLASGVRLLGCLQFIFVSQYNDSFVSQSGWWCPALRLSPIHVSSLVAIDLSPSLAGGVRLSGCLQVICFPLWQFICFWLWRCLF